MGCASNHRIDVSFFNVEVDVESVEDLEGDLAQHLVDHLNIAVTPGDILGSLFADLHPC